jgi:hypothetical protein
MEKMLLKWNDLSWYLKVPVVGGWFTVLLFIYGFVSGMLGY